MQRSRANSIPFRESLSAMLSVASSFAKLTYLLAYHPFRIEIAYRPSSRLQSVALYSSMALHRNFFNRVFHPIVPTEIECRWSTTSVQHKSACFLLTQKLVFCCNFLFDIFFQLIYVPSFPVDPLPEAASQGRRGASAKANYILLFKRKKSISVFLWASGAWKRD